MIMSLFAVPASSTRETFRAQAQDVLASKNTNCVYLTQFSDVSEPWEAMYSTCTQQIRVFEFLQAKPLILHCIYLLGQIFKFHPK